MAGSDPRILVADGEPDLLAAIDFTLRGEGYDTASVLDGETALELARSERFDLVILDARLPGLSGAEVSRRLRAQSDVPILVFAVGDDAGDRRRHLETGASDYFVHTAPLSELVRRVRTLLEDEA